MRLQKRHHPPVMDPSDTHQAKRPRFHQPITRESSDDPAPAAVTPAVPPPPPLSDADIERWRHHGGPGAIPPRKLYDFQWRSCGPMHVLFYRLVNE